MEARLQARLAGAKELTVTAAPRTLDKAGVKIELTGELLKGIGDWEAAAQFEWLAGHLRAREMAFEIRKSDQREHPR